MTIRVVLAEDNNLLREGLVRLLAPVEDIEVVAAVRNLPALYDAVAAHEPDVLVTDIRMPPGQEDEGLQAAHRYRSERPELGVVVVSQHVTPRYAVDLLGDGTSGRAYLLKDRVADVNELARAIRQVSEGGSAVDPIVIDELLAGLPANGSPLKQLSSREREVLEHVAAGQSNGAIADRLHVSQRAVEKHVSSVFTKLELPDDDAANRRVMAVVVYLAHLREGRQN